MMKTDVEKKNMEMVVDKIRVILKFANQPNKNTQDDILKILIDSYKNRIIMSSNS